MAIITTGIMFPPLQTHTSASIARAIIDNPNYQMLTNLADFSFSIRNHQLVILLGNENQSPVEAFDTRDFLRGRNLLSNPLGLKLSDLLANAAQTVHDLPPPPAVSIAELAGQYVDPQKMTEATYTLVQLDYLGQILGFQRGRLIPIGALDDLVTALSPPPAKIASENERDVSSRIERNCLIHFMSAVDDLEDEKAQAFRQEAEALWNGETEEARVRDFFCRAAIELDEHPQVQTLAFELDNAVSKKKWPSQYQDDFTGRRFESEFARILVENPPDAILRAMRIFADQLVQDYERIGNDRVRNMLNRAAVDHLVRPWFSRRNDLTDFVQHHSTRTARDILSVVADGYDIISVIYMAGLYGQLVNELDPRAAQWFKDATSNYTFVVGPGRSIVSNILRKMPDAADIEAGENNEKHLPKDPGPATTSSHGTGLNFHPDYDAYADFGAGIDKTLEKRPGGRSGLFGNLVTVVVGEGDASLDNLTPFEKKAHTHGGHPAISGLSGTTNITAFLSDYLSRRNDQFSKEQILLATLMFVIFDGGHPANEVVPVWTSVAEGRWLLERKLLMENAVLRYENLIHLAGDSAEEIRTALREALTRTIAYFRKHSYYAKIAHPATDLETTQEIRATRRAILQLERGDAADNPQNKAALQEQRENLGNALRQRQQRLVEQYQYWSELQRTAPELPKNISPESLQISGKKQLKLIHKLQKAGEKLLRTDQELVGLHLKALDRLHEQSNEAGLPANEKRARKERVQRTQQALLTRVESIRAFMQQQRTDIIYKSDDVIKTHAEAAYDATDRFRVGRPHEFLNASIAKVEIEQYLQEARQSLEETRVDNLPRHEQALHSMYLQVSGEIEYAEHEEIDDRLPYNELNKLKQLQKRLENDLKAVQDEVAPILQQQKEMAKERVDLAQGNDVALATARQRLRAAEMEQAHFQQRRVLSDDQFNAENARKAAEEKRQEDEIRARKNKLLKLESDQYRWSPDRILSFNEARTELSVPALTLVELANRNTQRQNTQRPLGPRRPEAPYEFRQVAATQRAVSDSWQSISRTWDDMREQRANTMQHYKQLRQQIEFDERHTLPEAIQLQKQHCSHLLAHLATESHLAQIEDDVNQKWNEIEALGDEMIEEVRVTRDGLDRMIRRADTAIDVGRQEATRLYNLNRNYDAQSVNLEVGTITERRVAMLAERVVLETDLNELQNEMEITRALKDMAVSSRSASTHNTSSSSSSGSSHSGDSDDSDDSKKKYFKDDDSSESDGDKKKKKGKEKDTSKKKASGTSKAMTQSSGSTHATSSSSLTSKADNKKTTPRRWSPETTQQVMNNLDKDDQDFIKKYMSTQKFTNIFNMSAPVVSEELVAGYARVKEDNGEPYQTKDGKIFLVKNNVQPLILVVDAKLQQHLLEDGNGKLNGKLSKTQDNAQDIVVKSTQVPKGLKRK